MKLGKLYKNRICSCGSGRKYRDCCEKNKPIGVASLLDEELSNLQEKIIEFGLKEYKFEILYDFPTRIDHNYFVDDEDYEMFYYIHIIWFIVTIPVQKGKTILKLYLEKNSNNRKDTPIYKFIKDWHNVRPIAGRVVYSSSSELVINDVYTNNDVYVRLLEPLSYIENDFLFGFLLPFGKEYIFLKEPFYFQWIENMEMLLFIAWGKSVHVNYYLFLQWDFFNLLNELLLIKLTKNPDEIPWRKEEHRNVSLLFEKMMVEDNEPEWIVRTSFYLWYKYCSKEPKLIKKHESYAAAIHYLTLITNPLCQLTKKEIAKKYDIAQSTLWVAINDLQFSLTEEIKDLRKIYLEKIEKDLVVREENDILWID